MSISDTDLRSALKLIDYQLSSIACQIVALDNKINSLEQKIFENKPITPHNFNQSTNLLHNDDAKLMFETNFEHKTELLDIGITELLNDIPGDSEPKSDIICKNEDSDPNTNSIQEASDSFELISLHDEGGRESQGESNEMVKKEATDFLSMLVFSNDQNCTPPEAVQSGSDQSISQPSSIISVNSLPSSEPNTKTKNSINPNLILQLLSKFIKIKERQEYTEHYNAVLNFFITELKTDDVFDKIYRGHVMGGSYTDDLKVSKPNEFDTLLRFNFGVDKTKIKVEKCKRKRGYCTINLNKCDLTNKPHLNRFLDENGYILQDEILKWMQRLFTIILQRHDQNNKTIHINNHSYQYAHSRHGPAFTFTVNVLGTDIKFDMDLVPAFPFDENNWLATRKYPDKNQIKWVAVPKPPKEGISNKDISFICSYTELEKTYLHDANNAKNLIRLFKKLRDRNNLPALKSYFIKTIFLWQFHNTTVAERNAFWSQPLDVLFAKMLKIILDHLERRELYFFWDTTYNMFSTIQPTVLKSIHDYLRGIYSKITSAWKVNKHLEYLIDIILTKDEKAIFLLEHEEKLSVILSVVA